MRDHLLDITIPPEIVIKANDVIKSFIHCEIPPSIQFSLYSDNKWEISSIKCNLKSCYQVGVYPATCICEACKIKKKTGKYPGEDFNPLKEIFGD